MSKEILQQYPQKPSSWVNGDKIWDTAITLGGVDLGRFNAYCESHPKLMKALADASCYTRPVLGGIALSSYVHAVREDNRLLAAISLGLFGVAALSDSTDGYFARKGNVTDKEGAVLDQMMDVIFRTEILTTLLIGGDKADLMLLPPRMYYELQLLGLRNNNEDLKVEFKSSSLGKAKVVSDMFMGGSLFTQQIAKREPTKRIWSGLRKTAAITSTGLVAADVHRRKIQSLR